MRRGHPATALLALALALPACAGPRPPLPAGAAVAVPDHWRSGEASQASAPIAVQWWRALGDPALDALVEEGLAASPNLLAATARIEVARAQFRLAGAPGRVAVSADGGGATSRTINAFGQGLDQTQANGELVVSWEADLFGRIRAASDAGRAALAASVYARDGVSVALAATIVTGYVGLRSRDAQLDIAKATLAARDAELAVIRRRTAAGYSARLELAQAETAREATARLVSESELAVTRQENALSVLVGRAPGPIARGLPLDRMAGLAVPSALPGDLLRQRPDVREAEQRIVAADRTLDSARAAFMPRLTLRGSLGAAASTVLADPITLFSAGGSILAPIFQRGELRANADAAAGQRDIAAFAYRKTVLTGLQEVEDAQAGLARYGEQAAISARQVASAQQAYDLARSRYREGYAAYLEQLDAQRTLLDAQLRAVTVAEARLAALVALTRGLGGGWVAPASVEPTR